MPAHAVLITGGGGFLGQRIARHLVRAGRSVVLLDQAVYPRQRGAADEESDSGTAWAVGDVRQRTVVQAVAAAGGVCDVVHCAAVAGGQDAERNPHGSATTNVQGSLAVLETARRLRLRRMIDLSSEEVYGDSSRAEIDEDCPLAPTSFYGLHKATVERLGETWVRHGVDYVAARLAWVYGSGFPRDRLPAPWLRDAASNQKSSLEHGGDHEVDLVYIDDAAEAIVALLHPTGCSTGPTTLPAENPPGYVTWPPPYTWYVLAGPATWARLATRAGCTLRLVCQADPARRRAGSRALA